MGHPFRPVGHGNRLPAGPVGRRNRDSDRSGEEGHGPRRGGLPGEARDRRLCPDRHNLHGRRGNHREVRHARSRQGDLSDCGNRLCRDLCRIVLRVVGASDSGSR